MASCEYYDCGWCYAPDDVKTNAGKFRVCKLPEDCPYLKSQMTDLDIIKECRQTGRTRTTTKKLLEKAYDEQMTEIEEVKAQLKVLEKKLALLEELEKTKSPVEECYKDWWGVYPGTEIWTNFDETRWVGFKAGYNAAYEQKVSEEQLATQKGNIKTLVEESVKWCEEHPDKNPLDWVKPQTPEQVADGLKEAFREAVKQGVVSSTKSPTLYDVIADWWDDTFTKKETSLQELVDKIEEWLPKEQSAAGSQNVYVECTVEGFNDCLNTIKRKLR